MALDLLLNLKSPAETLHPNGYFLFLYIFYDNFLKVLLCLFYYISNGKANRLLIKLNHSLWMDVYKISSLFVFSFKQIKDKRYGDFKGNDD